MIRFLLIVVCLCVVGCRDETDDQIADRVISRRKAIAEACGNRIVSIVDSGHRQTTITLDSGRKIVFESSKHKHDMQILEADIKAEAK